ADQRTEHCRQLRPTGNALLPRLDKIQNSRAGRRIRFDIRPIAAVDGSVHAGARPVKEAGKGRGIGKNALQLGGVEPHRQHQGSNGARGGATDALDLVLPGTIDIDGQHAEVFQRADGTEVGHPLATAAFQRQVLHILWSGNRHVGLRYSPTGNQLPPSSFSHAGGRPSARRRTRLVGKRTPHGSPPAISSPGPSSRSALSSAIGKYNSLVTGGKGPPIHGSPKFMK